jgi:hypothetical protein
LRGGGKEVTTALVELKHVRNKIGGGAVARAIDDVVNNENYGKLTLREAIKRFLHDDLPPEERSRVARGICTNIEALNVSLDRLYRLVYD